jgi:hypothetical protein
LNRRPFVVWVLALVTLGCTTEEKKHAGLDSNSIPISNDDLIDEDSTVAPKCCRAVSRPCRVSYERIMAEARKYIDCRVAVSGYVRHGEGEPWRLLGWDAAGPVPPDLGFELEVDAVADKLELSDLPPGQTVEAFVVGTYSGPLTGGSHDLNGHIKVETIDIGRVDIAPMNSEGVERLIGKGGPAGLDPG